jgi:hypothetical protein
MVHSPDYLPPTSLPPYATCDSVLILYTYPYSPSPTRPDPTRPNSTRLPSRMPHAAVLHSSPSTSMQMASASCHPNLALPLEHEPRGNTPDFWRSSRHRKPLPPLPEDEQEDEVFCVQIANHCNIDDDEGAAIKHLDPKRCVEWTGQQEIATSEHAVIEGPIGGFQSPYPMCSSGLYGPWFRPLHPKPDCDVISHLHQVQRRHIRPPL